MMAGLLIDLDGVIYEGERPVPGGAEAVAWLHGEDVPYLFLSNTTSRPRRGLVERLGRLGISADETRIFTPPVAAVRWLKENVAGPVALFVPEATNAEFREIPQLPAGAEAGAAAVVVGDLGEGWDFKTLNRAFRLLISEPRPPLVALGMTRYWRAEDGLRLDVAPFIVALEHACGTHPVVMGKPAAPFYRMALQRLGVPARQAVMVGDDIRGDVEGAQRAGLKGVLVRTGKFRDSDLTQGIRPDAVLDSIADLPRWWATEVG